MTARRKVQKFRLVEIAPFDARRGYKRCTLPGVGCTIVFDSAMPFRPIPTVADFWRNRMGELVVRFSSNQPYVFHYKALLRNGKPVPEKDIDEFGDYITELLIGWGGADFPPVDWY